MNFQRDMRLFFLVGGSICLYQYLKTNILRQFHAKFEKKISLL